MDKPSIRRKPNCSKCGLPKDSSHQSYCKKCFAAYNRERAFRLGKTKEIRPPRRYMPPGHKYCARCLGILPATLEHFAESAKAGKTGLTSYCRPCLDARTAEKLARGPRQQKTTILERFWKKVNKSGTVPAHCPELGPCWEWTGASDLSGYGKFMDRPAHRFAWMALVGDIPVGLFVCHRCDNRKCVRAGDGGHLFIGSALDNSRDMVSKNRQHRGENTGGVILDEPRAQLMRRVWNTGLFTQRELGLMFGVQQMTVSHVVRGKTWKEVG